MALSRSLTEFPLYVLNRLKSGVYTGGNGLQTIDVALHGAVMWYYVCVYLSVEAQRYASSSWFEPLLALQSPV